MGSRGKQLPLESPSLCKHMTVLLDTVQLSKVIKLSHLSTFLQREECGGLPGENSWMQTSLGGTDADDTLESACFSYSTIPSFTAATPNPHLRRYKSFLHLPCATDPPTACSRGLSATWPGAEQLWGCSGLLLLLVLLSTAEASSFQMFAGCVCAHFADA